MTLLLLACHFSLTLTLTPSTPRCVVLSCTATTCIIDTPEGYGETARRWEWKVGDVVECVDVGIDPTVGGDS